jgi:hypothetical protein
MLLQVQVWPEPSRLESDILNPRARFWKAVQEAMAGEPWLEPDGNIEARLRIELPQALQISMFELHSGPGKDIARYGGRNGDVDDMFSVGAMQYSSVGLRFVLRTADEVRMPLSLLARCLPAALSAVLRMPEGVAPFSVSVDRLPELPLATRNVVVRKNRTAPAPGLERYSSALPTGLALVALCLVLLIVMQHVNAVRTDAQALRASQEDLARTQALAFRQAAEQLATALAEARRAGTAPGAIVTPAPAAGAGTPAAAAASQMEAYRRAVPLAAVRQPSFVVQLPRIGAAQREVRVAHFTSRPLDASSRSRPIWVSLPEELRAAACRPGHDAVLGIQQTLGLPPVATPNWKVIEFTVGSADLTRPCFSGPSPDTTQCSFDLPPEPADSQAKLEEHRWLRFMLRQVAGSFRDGFTRTPAEAMQGSPFTGMGWTYNWNPELPTHVGVAEFVIFPDAKLQQVSPPIDPAEFCRASTTALTAAGPSSD